MFRESGFTLGDGQRSCDQAAMADGGPVVVLAYAQAAKMGLRQIAPALQPGIFAGPENAPGKPRAYVRYFPERGQDVAWENDRVAFRVFGPVVRAKVGSGIDVWAKSVDYPIIDKWYRLNAAGFDYHVDRGEGCDFYDMGHLRGCGGLAVWANERPYAALTYATQRIVRNEPDGIEFALTFAPWDAGGRRVTEEKTIRMVPGTNFFQVTSTLRAPGAEELVAGIGLTTYGKAAVREDAAAGILSYWEKIHPAHGSLGMAVVVDPRILVGFASQGRDRYLQVRARPNQPLRYYVGAGWDGNSRCKTANRWASYVHQESGWQALEQLYAP